jgi:hypothetical protein
MKSAINISEKRTQHEIDDKPLYYIEITSDSNLDFEYILIKNYYVHMISIVIYVNNKWNSILNDFKLMTDAESDEEGEKYCIIGKQQMLYDDKILGVKEINLMRIYLSQNSTTWKNFYLTEVQLVKEENTNSIYINNKSRFEFNPKTIILYNREEINQKYIEIMNVTNINEVNLKILK